MNNDSRSEWSKKQSLSQKQSADARQLLLLLRTIVWLRFCASLGRSSSSSVKVQFLIILIDSVRSCSTPTTPSTVPCTVQRVSFLFSPLESAAFRLCWTSWAKGGKKEGRNTHTASLPIFRLHSRAGNHCCTQGRPTATDQQQNTRRACTRSRTERPPDQHMPSLPFLLFICLPSRVK